MGVFAFLNQGIQENFIRRQKAEDRSQKPEDASPLQPVFFWLLTIVSEPFWLLASVFYFLGT
jgi:hypothetical protein